MVTLAPTALTFASQTVATKSAAQTVTLTNSGTAAMTNRGIAVSGDFTQVNNCPVSLAAGASCTTTVNFVPTATGTRTGILEFLNNAAGNPQWIALTGTGTSATAATLQAASSLTLGSIAPGSSTSQTLTISNTGTASATIQSIAVNGTTAFAVSGATLPASLAAGTSLSVRVIFAPPAAGTYTGTVTVQSNARNSTLSVGLSGTATGGGPVVTLAPTALSFASQTVATKSAAQTVTLTNSGTAAMTNRGIAVSGDFTQVNNCPASLAAGASCTVTVNFAPTTTGTRTGILEFLNNAAGNPQWIALTGTGTNSVAPVASVSPASYTFSNEVLGSTSPAGTVTMKNSGSAALAISSVSIAGDFAQSSNCPSSLAAGASCTVNVTFTPKAAGNRTGTLTFTDNATPGTQAVQLYGAAVQPGALAITPGQLAFGGVAIGATGSQTVNLANSGGAGVTVSMVSSSVAGFTVSGVSIPFTVAPSQSTSFQVTFAPTTQGSVSGAMQIANNSPTATITLPVSGTGEATPSHQVILQWQDAGSGIVGHYAYRGTVSGGPYTKLNSSAIAGTTYTDQSVKAGQTYYYVVTALGTDLVESPYSNQATATIPTP